MTKAVARIALRVEQRRQIAVVDARGGGLRHRGLAVVGDAEAGGLDHRDVVGAVADRHRFFRRKPEPLSQLPQRVELGLPAEDRLGDPSRELGIAVHQQDVGAILVEADHCADRLVKSVKPPDTRQV